MTYREGQKGASPTLARLAAKGRERRAKLEIRGEIAEEGVAPVVIPVDEQHERVLLALAPTDSTAAGDLLARAKQGDLSSVESAGGSELLAYGILALGLAALIGLAVLTVLWPLVGFVVMVAVGLLWMVAASGGAGSDRQRGLVARRRLRWSERQPFPIEGYRDWIAALRPIIEVRFERPVVPADVIDAIFAVDPGLAVEATEQSASIAIPLATTKRLQLRRHSSRNIETPHGDVPRFHRLMKRVLLPLHAEVGIAGIAMSGDPVPRSETPAS